MWSQSLTDKPREFVCLSLTHLTKSAFELTCRAPSLGLATAALEMTLEKLAPQGCGRTPASDARRSREAQLGLLQQLQSSAPAPRVFTSSATVGGRPLATWKHPVKMGRWPLKISLVKRFSRPFSWDLQNILNEANCFGVRRVLLGEVAGRLPPFPFHGRPNEATVDLRPREAIWTPVERAKSLAMSGATGLSWMGGHGGDGALHPTLAPLHVRPWRWVCCEHRLPGTGRSIASGGSTFS